MPLYNCECCNFSSKLKTNYTRHLSTKKHLRNINKFDQNQKKGIIGSYEFPPKPSEIPSKTLQNPPKTSEIAEKKYPCQYCNKIFSRLDNLQRHIKERCKESQNSMTYKELFLETKEQLKQEKEELKTQIKMLLSKVGNTTINNTNNIQLNSYGNENLSHITDSLKDELIKIPYGMIPKMIEQVHFNPNYPENKNIVLTNKNDNKIKVFSGSKWIYKNKNDTIDDLVDGKYFILDTHYENVCDKITSRNKTIYEQFRTFFDEKDKELHDKMKKECELVLLNNR